MKFIAGESTVLSTGESWLSHETTT